MLRGGCAILSDGWETDSNCGGVAHRLSVYSQFSVAGPSIDNWNIKNAKGKYHVSHYKEASGQAELERSRSG